MSGPFFGLLAAFLFGASTPFSKLLLGKVGPWWLSAILYLGSGLGISVLLAFRKLRGKPVLQEIYSKPAEWPWIMAATFFGGILGPTLLMYGLQRTAGSTGALLLNMEGVLTATLAWMVFREHYDRRIVAGMALIVAGGVVLSWTSSVDLGSLSGPLLILAACFSWAIDNNVTRKVSASDPMELTAIKSVTAGLTNLALAYAFDFSMPPVSLASFLGGALIGFFGYGMSLACFVLALRHLGASRTGAYFSTAPFVGALLSFLILQEPLTISMGLAGIFMGMGVWLHLSENHSHEHEHGELEHFHSHVHDEHHLHEHAAGDPVGEPHSHMHRHSRLVHSHPHFPDTHHQHEHP